MTVAPGLAVHIYRDRVIEVEHSLKQLETLLTPRSTIIFDGTGKKEVLVPPKKDHERPILARMQTSRQLQVTEDGRVWILESKNNTDPYWIKLIPVWVNGKFTGKVLDQKSRDVKVLVVGA